MYLTREQEKMLNGEYGWATAKAIELIIRVGEALGADRLIQVKHAHVSGVSYSNIGKYGLEFIVDFYKRGGRARVYTTINPGCIDYSGFSTIIDNKYMSEQKVIDDALIGMGFKPVFTCIPYYYRPPVQGEHLAWGESSAVIYANSIYGALTNREGGPIALAASITGYTYNAGLHLLENRVGRIIVKLDPVVKNTPMGAIGLFIGDVVKKTPVLHGLENIDFSELKILLASMAASGSHALAIIPGITPENTYRVEVEEELTIEKQDLEKYMGESLDLRHKSTSSVLGYLGCPHLHPLELLQIVELIRKYGRVRRGSLLLTLPPEYLDKYSFLINELRARGVDIAAGTCPVVSVFKKKYDYVLTNSGKAAFYLRRIHGLKTIITSLREVIRYICGY